MNYEFCYGENLTLRNGEGFSYPPEILTNSEFAKIVPLTESDDNEVEVVNPNFIGEYCSECAKKYDRCWCYKSDWDNDLMDIEIPKVLTNGSNNPQKLSLAMVPIRQPPPGWVEYRRWVTKQNTNKVKTLTLEKITQ